VKLSPKLLETVARAVFAESAHDLLGRGAFQIGKDGEKELLSVTPKGGAGSPHQ
jgi:hypothetical protein